MCYSAQIKAEFAKYQREFGAAMDIHQYVRLFWTRQGAKGLKIPRAIEQDFLRMPGDPAEVREAQRLIRDNDAALETAWQAEIFRQRARLVEAERKLASGKPTKKATEDVRIATAKIDQLLGWIAALKRTEPKGLDNRFFPGWYTHLMVVEDGRRVVKPMRYLCRPEGAPAWFDTRYSGAYNARLDTIREGTFWRKQFGRRHGILIATRFFEHVARHDMEHRELRPGEKPEDVVIEFAPMGLEEMLVACIWSDWREGEEQLLSFAAVTTDPPPEVAEAGHDRCIIPIRPENVDAWLNPDPSNLDAQFAVLEDRERPYYEHRMAA